MKKILSEFGDLISEPQAVNGHSSLLHDKPCDVLLLDISMPKVSGLELCLQLRSDERYAPMKIIAYTAHAMPEEMAQLQGVGFSRVLLKPIRRHDLLQAMLT